MYFEYLKSETAYREDLFTKIPLSLLAVNYFFSHSLFLLFKKVQALRVNSENLS